MPDPNRHTRLDIDTLLRRRRLLMVGGKGGVGKTTVASALALRAAGLERRVLLVSTDPAHSLADAFDREIGDRETDLAANLTGLEIDPASEVDAHLERVRAQMARFAGADQRPELERQLRLSRQSPGAQEAALLERITTIIDQQDRFVFLPMLYEVTTGSASCWEVAPPFPEVLAGSGVEFVQGTVAGLDTDSQLVRVAGGEGEAENGCSEGDKVHWSTSSC